LTALFLATKTTNHPISLETYTTHIPNTTPSDVLDLEFLVAQSLGFEFAVWHSHRALWGIWLDLQVSYSLKCFSDGTLLICFLKSLPDCPPDTREIYDKALSHVRASRLTDAELIYTPSQIAFAALSLAAPDLASQWSASKILPASPSSLLSADTLPVVMDGVKSFITSAGHLPNLEAVREVDRRLKLCKNPEKVVGSSAYLAKQAEEAKKAEDKRNRKAVEVHQTTTHGNPFGNELGASRLGMVDYDDDDDD
jgi:cyclin H